MPYSSSYIALSESCSLRRLETPHVYNKASDELYEIDDKALAFLLSCDGTRRLSEMDGEPEFVNYCLSEGILSSYPSERIRHVTVGEPPPNTLRYLELHLTNRCNLRCRHCYISAGTDRDMDLFKAFKAMDDFDSMQGLRLILSGGEPLMHKSFWYINERLSCYGFRTALLSNGGLITKEAASRLKVNEVQISLDGMKKSHDMLRGRGSFSKAVRAIEHLSEAGIQVSVATMINVLNREDFDDLGMLMESLGVSEWNIDVPSAMGRMKENRELMLPPDEAAPLMSMGYGGAHHGSSDGFACGSHLCAVGVDGTVSKCGFYLDRPAGHISEGLRACWDRLKPISISSLMCDCEFVEACKGGCRYRASSYGGELGPDPVMCYNLGVMCNEQPKGGECV